jgi:hypothetical protein
VLVVERPAVGCDDEATVTILVVDNSDGEGAVDSGAAATVELGAG